MNRNHSRDGRFCARSVARSCSPLLSDTRDDFMRVLRDVAVEVLGERGGDDAVAGDGPKAIVLMRPNGDIEIVSLSAEGYEAYADRTQEAERIDGHRGRVGGAQDGHNIRRGIRRWLRRNEGFVQIEGHSLCVIRDGDSLLLSAVRHADDEPE